MITEQRTETTGLLQYALDLHQKYGFNVMPMRNDRKSPARPWKLYTQRAQTEEEIRSFVWDTNIGIINGINDTHSIDLDRCDDPEILFKILELLGLDFEYPWVVYSPGKGGGFHIHFKSPGDLTLTSNGVLCGDPLDETMFKQVELRWKDSVTMIPPSIHPEEKTPYEWHLIDPKVPLAVIPVELVEKAFLAIATPQKPKEKDSTTEKPVKFDSWAQRAFDQEISILRSVASGQRNSQLNRSAFNLGQIVGANLLARQEVIDALTRTAVVIGLDEEEIAPTIKSGLEAGIKKPRMPKQVFKANEPPLKLPSARKVDDTVLASFTADDQGNAEAVYHLYGPYIAHNEAYGWLIWDGNHFVTSVQRINTLIVEVLRLRMRAAAHLERTDIAKVARCMAGTVSAARSLLENLAHVDVSEFDSEPDLINTLSGVVDLRTKRIIPHDPSYRFTWCAPVKYNPSASTVTWLDFLAETLESEEMIDYLQQALGYSISGYISEEVLFYIYGPPRSGKGTLSETILAIFPRPIAIEVDFNTFTAKREGDAQNFDLAGMKAARLVFASESNKYQSLNPGKVKALTGGNMVHCAFKHKDFFSYQPQYAVWLSSNHEVNADADDDALWGRVKVINFPHSRLGQEDKTLKRRMQSPVNLEAVLAWLVEGAYQWYQHEGQGLETPDAVRQLTMEQRASQDTVGLWLEECCEKSEGNWVANTLLMQSYDNWCEANGYEPKKAKGLAQSLAAHKFEVGVVKWISATPGDKGKATRGVCGLLIL